ncbi:ubiquinone biosynthesis O-methyltransferase [Epithele typhae]|uniref:ubiquinone biosynthesis O-methyltransferase n=1 Tax=Epithele typhae TaxID=378194 RepID=UPI002008341F|nr:ubiquinone biosynthesis O-methyltransferase [Epithele typhae]KAH9940917.1 ubiquinone biosynthesis O-methyltransferase [Epithele typhae]
MPTSFTRVARVPRTALLRTSRPLATTCRRHSTLSNATPGHSGSNGQSSVNSDEIAHFSKLSQTWWDERGEFGLLHRMNPVRMEFVRQKVLEIQREDGEEDVNEARPLTGLDVLDVGCGGGLLSEALARLGGRTLGIDATPSNIAMASMHAGADPSFSAGASSKGKGTLAYEHTSVEDLLARRGPQSFDVVCSMEVIEHVDNPRTFLSNCATLVKPGGHLFLSTIARTPLSYALTILAAEHLLQLVTPGTHTYSKYINPDELAGFFLEAPVTSDAPETERPWISRLYGGRPLRTEAEICGMVYVPWKGEWTLVPRGAPGASVWAEGCNYMFWIRRPLVAA